MSQNQMRNQVRDDDLIGFVDIGMGHVTVVAANIKYTKGLFDIVATVTRGFAATAPDDNMQYEAMVLALDEVERMTNARIDKVVMSIHARHICSTTIRVCSNFKTQTKIDRFTLDTLLKKAIKYYDVRNKDKSIIDIHCHHCTIDKAIKLINPIGATAMQIQAQVNIISTMNSVLDRLNHYMSSCRVNVINYIPAPSAAAASCFAPSEFRNRTLILNFGSSEVGVALYNEGNMEYIDCVSIAGFFITSSIAKTFAISINDAEMLKIKLGSLYASENTIIDTSDMFNTACEAQIIRTSDVIRVVKKCLREIVMTVRDKFESQMKQSIRSISGIVITGGVSNTVGIDTFVRSLLGVSCRIGTFTQIENEANLEDNKTTRITTGMMTCMLRSYSKISLYHGSATSLTEYMHKFACFLEKLFF